MPRHAARTRQLSVGRRAYSTNGSVRTVMRSFPLCVDAVALTKRPKAPCAPTRPGRGRPALYKTEPLANSPMSGGWPWSRQRRQAFGSESCGHQSGTASHHFGPRRGSDGSDEPEASEFAAESAPSGPGSAAGMRGGDGVGVRVVDVGEGVAVGVGDVDRGVGDGSDVVCADVAEAPGSSRARGSELPIAIAAATTAATAATEAAAARSRPADLGWEVLEALRAIRPDAGTTAPAAVAAGETVAADPCAAPEREVVAPDVTPGSAPTAPATLAAATPPPTATAGASRAGHRTPRRSDTSRRSSSWRARQCWHWSRWSDTHWSSLGVSVPRTYAASLGTYGRHSSGMAEERWTDR